ncbi:MAG: hypothetical protein LBJ22_07910 [Synergistaceae bacterium]|nr:hypothetical protein [Synergistaceae bacterium]
MPNNDTVGKLLEGGDVIRWSGSPQPYEIFDEAHKTSTFMTLFWALLWGVLLVGGYYAFCVSRGLELKTVVMVICVAIPLLIAWSPVGDKNNIKKLSYTVTDKKIIVVPSENSKEYVLPIVDIDTIRIEKAGSGTCHMRFGSPAFKASTKKLLGLAIRGEFKVGKNDEKTYTGLVFYNISVGDGDVICDLLKSRISIEGNAAV